MKSPKKRILIFATIGLLTFVSLLFYTLGPTLGPALMNKMALKDDRLQEIFKMRDLYNNPVKPIETPFIIINFWASWCPPCVEETPSLILFTEKFRKHFTLLAFSQDTTKKDVESFIKVFPALKSKAVTVIHDDSQSFARAFSANKLPETFIYSIQQNRYMQLSGSTNWDQPEVISAIETYFHTKFE